MVIILTKESGVSIAMLAHFVAYCLVKATKEKVEALMALADLRGELLAMQERVKPQSGCHSTQLTSKSNLFSSLKFSSKAILPSWISLTPDEPFERMKYGVLEGQGDVPGLEEAMSRSVFEWPKYSHSCPSRFLLSGSKERTMPSGRCCSRSMIQFNWYKE